MPEMPEVEVVRRGLAEHVVGRQVHFAETLHPRTTRRQPGGAAEFAVLLTGRTLVDTGRRGKFLWVVTDDPDVLLAAHLGMSGQFRVTGLARSREAVADPHPHARARLELDTADVWFLDQRTFGWLWAAPAVTDSRGVTVPLPVRDIAPDLSDPTVDPRELARSMRRHQVEVKRLLLSQTLVSGIGNIYADEALWRARVHPQRRADRLSLGALTSVIRAAREVMVEALAVGGTSFDSLYVDVNGRSGYFERGLAVYGREGLPCPRCGSPIRRISFMNRSSHFCPKCQPAPRGRG
jgi:formamidopyrimidine-DNA glycosylase